MTIARPNEGDVKKAVKRLLDAHGWYHWSPPANTYGVGGQSDILALKRGQFLAIETKLKKATGTALQEKFIDDVVAAGGLGLVVNMAKVPKFAELLKRLDLALK